MMPIRLCAEPAAIDRYSRCCAREIGFEHQRRHADHAVQRRAQLVAHVGHELALGAVGVLGALLGRLQLAACARPPAVRAWRDAGQLGVADSISASMALKPADSRPISSAPLGAVDADAVVAVHAHAGHGLREPRSGATIDALHARATARPRGPSRAGTPPAPMTSTRRIDGLQLVEAGLDVHRPDCAPLCTTGRIDRDRRRRARPPSAPSTRGRRAGERVARVVGDARADPVVDGRGRHVAAGSAASAACPRRSAGRRTPAPRRCWRRPRRPACRRRRAARCGTRCSPTPSMLPSASASARALASTVMSVSRLADARVRAGQRKKPRHLPIGPPSDSPSASAAAADCGMSRPSCAWRNPRTLSCRAPPAAARSPACCCSPWRWPARRTTPHGAGSDRADSREVKAVFLVNFLSFAEWPAAKLGAPPAQLDDRRPGRSLVRGARGAGRRRPHGRTAARSPCRRSTRRSRRLDGAPACSSPSSQARRLPAVLRALADATVLTVGDTDGFAQRRRGHQPLHVRQPRAHRSEQHGGGTGGRAPERQPDAARPDRGVRQRRRR